MKNSLTTVFTGCLPVTADFMGTIVVAFLVVVVALVVVVDDVT